jgi:hypothetical protein
MIFDDIIKISQERKIGMRTAASIMAIGRVAVAELSKEIANMITHSSSLVKKGRRDLLSEERLNVIRNYLTYLGSDLMKRIPLDYWTLVTLISNMESVITTNNLPDESIIEIVKDIYTEAIHLFASFVKAKPDNDDLLMAMSALPEGARKQL